jgi:ATP-dependent helicase Lhr and Lhr-like helicase
VESLRRILQQLDGLTAPATAWESDILPARLPHYDPAWLDQLCISGQICWGRLLQPRVLQSREASGGKLAGPVKNTPLNLVQRRNVDLWQALAKEMLDKNLNVIPAKAGIQTSQIAGFPSTRERRAKQSDATQQESDSIQASTMSSAAEQVHQLLQKHGASFFTDLTRLAGLLPVQTEQALAELVSLGLVTSDNFTGLRALLTPDSHKPKLGSHERRRAIYGIEDAGRWSLLNFATASEVVEQGASTQVNANALNDEQLERLIQLYFARWGVINRKVLEREQNAPTWRQLLLKLRRMELRGDVRGGRFIAGVGGEQFALADTVTALRKQQKLWQEQQEAANNVMASEPNQKARAPLRHIINATDPLNLLGSLLPDKRVPHLSGNRILFEDGLPIAVLEKDEVKLLRNHDSHMQWELQRLLQKKTFPPRLRAYIGKV